TPTISDRRQLIGRECISRLELRRALELRLGRRVVALAQMTKTGVRVRSRRGAVVGIARGEREATQSFLFLPRHALKPAKAVVELGVVRRHLQRTAEI